MVSREELLKIARSEEFLEAVTVELTKRPHLLRMITEAALGKVATKEDIERVRKELREDIERVRREMREDIEKLRREVKGDIAALDRRVDGLSDRVSRLEGSVSLLIRLFIAFNVPILVGIIGILLKMAFAS